MLKSGTSSTARSTSEVRSCACTTIGGSFNDSVTGEMRSLQDKEANFFKAKSQSVKTREETKPWCNLRTQKIGNPARLFAKICCMRKQSGNTVTQIGHCPLRPDFLSILQVVFKISRIRFLTFWYFEVNRNVAATLFNNVHKSRDNFWSRGRL